MMASITVLRNESSITSTRSSRICPQEKEEKGGKGDPRSYRSAQ